MDGDGSKVQVYIYDVTKGLAAQLSPMFLGKGWYGMPLCSVLSWIAYHFSSTGKQIDGIW